MGAPLPSHHRPGGGFRNPWAGGPLSDGQGFLRWQRERRGQTLAPDPPPGAFPVARPDVAHPRADPSELRVTWVGHATFLVQIGGLNLLTDPHWSRRASPTQLAGPARFAPPGLPFDALPPIDAVLLSHDHYDHLDARTVRRLHARFGDALRFHAPLGYRRWFERRGVRNLVELDWWEEAELASPAGTLRVRALPSQHWTSRAFFDRYRKLWASWSVHAPGGRSLHFCGDTGSFPGLAEIGRKAGPFDALILPVGAYEPRWFMRSMHMNPEDAADAYGELGGEGLLIGSHWGTWRLTDEDPMEPPRRMREVWSARGLAPERLWVPKHGETRVV